MQALHPCSLSKIFLFHTEKLNCYWLFLFCGWKSYLLLITQLMYLFNWCNILGHPIIKELLFLLFSRKIFNYLDLSKKYIASTCKQKKNDFHTKNWNKVEEFPVPSILTSYNLLKCHSWWKDVGTHTHDPKILETMQEDCHKFKSHMIYIVNSRPISIIYTKGLKDEKTSHSYVLLD